MQQKVSEYTLVADFEDEERKPQTKEHESQPPEAEKGLQLTVSKETETSVLQPHGTEFCRFS